jgi:hypothetical protein
LEEAIAIASDRVMNDMTGDQEAMLLRGYGKVYVMHGATQYFDSQALRQDDAALYEKYLKPRIASAYLRTYPNKEKNATG